MDADAAGFDNPDLAVDRLYLQQRGKLLDSRKDRGGRKLAPAVEDRNSSSVLGWKTKHLTEVTIESYEHAAC
jgi:hypothetical protein